MYTIATHNGSFHADDVFAIATLLLIFGKEQCSIVRTRDDELIARTDIVVDVGGIYNPDIKRFDHHQLGAPVRENSIPYAAFGLVWKEYGLQLCGDELIVSRIDELLVQAIDAGDNGVKLYESTHTAIVPYELYQVVGSYAPPWGSEEDSDKAFAKAVDFAIGLLERVIAQKQAEANMHELVEAVYQTADDKRFLVFDVPVSPLSCIQYPDVQLVVSPKNKSSDTHWTVNAVRKDFGTFESRVQFPLAWAGLRDVELADSSGIADAVFCHKARFLFVAESREGALAAVRKTIE